MSIRVPRWLIGTTVALAVMAVGAVAGVYLYAVAEQRAIMRRLGWCV